MTSQQDATRALNLAGQVLRNQMSLDEALLVANAANILVPLIESLNVLANAPLFNQAELEKRVQSGNAQFAVEGIIPKLQLSPMLVQQTSVEPQQVDDRQDVHLKELDLKVAKLQDAELDIKHQLDFFQAIEKNRPVPSNPWLSGIIIMAIGSVLSTVAGFVAHSGLAALVLFIATAILALLVFMREMKKYESLVQKAAREDEHRRQKKDQCVKDLETLQNEVAALMQDAHKVLNRLELSGEEARQQAMVTYPRLFWKVFNQSDRKNNT